MPVHAPAPDDSDGRVGPPTPPRPPAPAASESPSATVFPTEPFLDGRGQTLAVRTFRDEATDLQGLTRLCEEELSEPYNVYTFRYFLTEWPHLTFFVYPSATHAEPIATIICKQAPHRERTDRGYIGMLSVTHKWRRRGIARKLVELAVGVMAAWGAHEIVLETEYDNAPSLALYEALGFVREKRLHRFYSNGKDAYRLILPLAGHPLLVSAEAADRERWLQSDGSGGGAEANAAGKDDLPPEVAFALAGPAAGPPTSQVALLSLHDPLPRPSPPLLRAPGGHYI